MRTILPVLLVLTIYISVLMSLTRAYRDSEMVIWFASGQSLLAWVRRHRSWLIALVLLSLFVSVLGYFTNPVSLPGMCKIYG